MNDKQVKFEIWWDEDEQTIRMKIIGKMGIDDAKQCVLELKGLMEDLKKKGVKHMDSINDATEAGITLNPKFRKIFVDFLSTDDLKNVRSVIFGLGKSQKMVVNFLVGLSGANHFRFFGKEEEALKWLKEAKKERDLLESKNIK